MISTVTDCRLHGRSRANFLARRQSLPLHGGKGPRFEAVTSPSRPVDNYVHNICGEPVEGTSGLVRKAGCHGPLALPFNAPARVDLSIPQRSGLPGVGSWSARLPNWLASSWRDICRRHEARRLTSDVEGSRPRFGKPRWPCHAFSQAKSDKASTGRPVGGQLRLQRAHVCPL